MEAVAQDVAVLPSQARASSASDEASTIAEPGHCGAEELMPYEAVAKAIFVKANGLAAYYQTTGRVGTSSVQPAFLLR